VGKARKSEIVDEKAGGLMVESRHVSEFHLNPRTARHYTFAIDQAE